jgi:hypothetical protein
MHELHFKEWFNEVARWKQSSWQRPSKDSLERLKLYDKGHFVHFSKLPNKIGVNPQTQHTDYTPYGIYAYPVKYAIQEGIVGLPYAEDLPYIWVFKPKNPKNVKRINNYAYGQKNRQIYLDGIEEARSVQRMHAVFLNKGIEGFVDEGTSTIHPSEPYQAVFFGSHTIQPIDVFENTYVQKSQEKQMKQMAKTFGVPIDTYDDSDFDPDTFDPYSDPDFLKHAEKDFAYDDWN